MHLTSQALVLAALGLGCAIAQPAGSPHRHLHKHAKKQIGGSWDDAANYAGVDWATVNFGGPTPATAAAVAATAAAVAATPAAVAATPAVVAAIAPAPNGAAASVATDPSSSSSSNANDTGSSGSSSGSVTYQPSGCPAGGFGGQTTPVNNGNVDEYVGNIGSPYGCNMMLVSTVDGYTYTNTFQNTGSSSMDIIIWNKAGNPSLPAPGNGANAGQSNPPNLGFTLPAGASQIVAFDANSQVAWSQDCSRNSDDGAPDCTWGEGDFGNASNEGWSGYDVSLIQNSAGNNLAMSITSSAQNAGQASSNTENDWTSADQSNQGAGGSIPPTANPVRLLTTYG